MGKVLVNGFAEQDYEPDYGKVTLTVESVNDSVTKAVTTTAEEFERLVAGLSDLGIKTKSITVFNDRSDKPNKWEKTSGYSACKALRFHVPVDMVLINRIHDLVASDFENTIFKIDFDLSRQNQIIRDLKVLAIQDSRRGADLLAETIGSRIIGIEAAKFDDEYDMDMEIADLDLSIIVEPGKETVHYCRRSDEKSSTPFTDKLKPAKINMSANVSIVWLLE